MKDGCSGGMEGWESLDCDCCVVVEARRMGTIYCWPLAVALRDENASLGERVAIATTTLTVQILRRFLEVVNPFRKHLEFRPDILADSG